MEQQTQLLQGYSDNEKGAYLGVIASLATADRSASEEELNYLQALTESAQISDDQAQLIRDAASSEVSDEDLKRCLDVLKTSDLRYPLVSDLIAFSESDESYSEDEKKHVQAVAKYLGVNQEQYSVLDQFTKKAIAQAPTQQNDDENTSTNPTGFLENLGFGDKLKNAGINTNGLLKGALSIIGPMLLMKMLSGRRGGGGMFGGGGGMLGGGLLGSLLGGGGGGGLLGGLLGGGRGMSNTGGLLGRIFGGR